MKLDLKHVPLPGQVTGIFFSSYSYTNSKLGFWTVLQKFLKIICAYFWLLLCIFFQFSRSLFLPAPKKSLHILTCPKINEELLNEYSTAFSSASAADEINVDAYKPEEVSNSCQWISSQYELPRQNSTVSSGKGSLRRRKTSLTES